MILDCFRCGARYLLSDSAVGRDGRQVRCGRCGHVWHARTKPAALALTLSSSASQRPDAWPAIVTPPARPSIFPAGVGGGLWQAQIPFPEPQAVRRIPMRLKNGMAVLSGALLLSCSGLLMVWSTAFGAQPSVPPLAPLIASLPPKLEPQLLATRQAPADRLNLSLLSAPTYSIMANERSQFAFSARIENKSTERMIVPDIVADLRDGEGRPIYSWHIHAPRDALDPGEKVDFDSAEVNVPANSASLRLSFLTHPSRREAN